MYDIRSFNEEVRNITKGANWFDAFNDTIGVERGKMDVYVIL